MGDNVVSMATSLEMPAGRPQGWRDLDGCVHLTTLFRSPLVELVQWRCLRDGVPLRRERQHTWPVMGWTDAGASVLHRREGSMVVEPASVLLHQPHAPYRTSHPYGCGDEGCNLALSPALVQEARGGTDPTAPWPATSALVPMRSRLRVFSLARRLREGRVVEPLVFEEAALQLLEDVLTPHERLRRPTRRSSTEDWHRDLVERVKAILVQDMAEPLRLDQVARRAGASPFHLARLFREQTGIPIHEYLTRLRLLSSLPRVMEPAELTRAALDLGFSSHSHMTAAFRRRFGVTPSQARLRVLAVPFQPL
jgi:AraC-like DNA-binding protein